MFYKYLKLNNIFVIVFILGLLSSSVVNAQHTADDTRKDEKDKKQKSVKKDSLSPVIKSWYVSDDDVTQRRFQSPDTLPDNFYIANPVQRSSFVNSYLGNLGLAAMPAIYFHETVRFESSNIYSAVFEDYDDCSFLFSRFVSMNFLSPRNVKFYNTNMPFTILTYNSASKRREEQQFKFVHTQNINPFLNFSLIFNGIKSAGEFDAQATKSKSMGATFNYDSKRYQARLFVANNKLEAEQSGGFTNDDTDSQKDYFPAKISGANTVNFNRHISFSQSLFFIRKMRKDTLSLSDSTNLVLLNDSISAAKTNLPNTNNLQVEGTKGGNENPVRKNMPDKKTVFPILADTTLLVSPDSLAGIAPPDSLAEHKTVVDTISTFAFLKQKVHLYFKPPIKPSHYYYAMSVSHRISFDKNFYKYTDAGTSSSYYDTIYRSVAAASDSVYYHTLRNDIQLKFHSFEEARFATNAYVGIGHEANKYHYLRHFVSLQNDSSFSSTNLHGGISGNITDMLFWRAKGEYYFVGHKANTFKLEGDITKRIKIFNDTLDFVVSLSDRLLKPDIFESRYFSTYFQWDSNLADKEIRKIGIALHYPKLHLSLSYNFAELTKPVFFDESALPQQYSGKVIIQSATLMKDFAFSWFRWNNRVVYQQSDNNRVLPLPEICAYTSFFFERKLFKVLNVQLGFDVYFNTNWNSYKYMPATGQFYVQHDVESGEIPVVDVFLNLKLKNRALLFFKGENMYELFSEDKYFPTTDYPIDGTAFKFGVSWWFHD